jgi:spore photoproduct lyase
MFKPDTVFFENEAMEYKEGVELYNKLKEEKVNIHIIKSNRLNIDFNNEREKYLKYKKILIIAKRKSFQFQTCKPSANYQLPLATGCEGMCQYCYLNTRFYDRPYVKAYINVDEILDKAQEKINEAEGEDVVFEGAATSDPITVEKYTNGIKKSILFFSHTENGYFRFVTKFPYIDSLLNLDHNKKTKVRFSLNTDKVIKVYENNVSNLQDRINAAKKMYKAGYPLGFIIAPVFLENDWEKDYFTLLEKINSEFDNNSDLEFEVISHRFTKKAKEITEIVFPNNKLPLNESERKFKYGQFGYGKYIYDNDKLNIMKNFFNEKIDALFPNAHIKYII